MIYKELLKFTNNSHNKQIEQLINPEVGIIKENSLHETINSIYSFKDDSIAIKDSTKFENYRRNYPDRYEWGHYETKYKIPSS